MLFLQNAELVQVNDDIGADELVRRLKQLANAFQVNKSNHFSNPDERKLSLTKVDWGNFCLSYLH